MDVRPNVGAGISVFAVFLISLCFLVFFADRTGYEGDDINSILSMLHLKDARNGEIAIYRYDWQPLSYQIGSALAQIARSPEPVFLLSSLSIAIALSMFYLLLRQLWSVTPVIFACIVLLSPEILYSGLYYNSAALGYAAAVGALFLTFRQPGLAQAIAIGAALGLAALLRLDFLLIFPAMLMLGLIRSGTLKWPVLSGTIACLCLIAAHVTGMMRFEEVLAIYETASAEIAAKANDGGWDTYTKAFVATTIFSPLGFVYYGLGTIWLLWISSRRERLQGLLVAAALLPALLPLPNLLSVKYMLPAFVFLPLLGGRIWYEAHQRVPNHRSVFDTALVGVTLIHCVAAVEPVNQKPYLRFAVTTPRQIPTHDGDRTWGSYLTQIARIERFGEAPEHQILGQELARAVLTEPARTILFIGDDTAFNAGSVGWRYAALALAYEGMPGTVLDTGLKRIATGSGELWLSVSLENIPTDLRDAPDTIVLHADDPGFAEDVLALSSGPGAS